MNRLRSSKATFKYSSLSWKQIKKKNSFSALNAKNREIPLSKKKLKKITSEPYDLSIGYVFQPNMIKLCPLVWAVGEGIMLFPCSFRHFCTLLNKKKLKEYWNTTNDYLIEMRRVAIDATFHQDKIDNNLADKSCLRLNAIDLISPNKNSTSDTLWESYGVLYLLV